MAGPCPPRFDSLAQTLGDFGCRTAEPVVQVRAPWELTNWTLVVVEILMVAGAAYALWHGIVRWRRAGDPMALGVWISSVVYLLLLEPMVYFPKQLGIPGQQEVVFVHNAFTVQFMFDRLPLYIVALYPAMITLAYELARVLGVFRRHRLIVGAICVGALHHCFYEVFDHIGPQLRWWIWDPDAGPNNLMFTSVPLTSNIFFASIGPIVLVLCTTWLVGRRAGRQPTPTNGALLGRCLGAGALMLPAMAILGAPWTGFVKAMPPDAGPPIAVVFGVVMGAVVVALVVDTWRRSARRSGASADSGLRYVQVHGWTYLAVFAFLWAIALPDFFDAVGGVTSDGTDVGSLPYAALSFVCCAAALATVATRAPEHERSDGRGLDDALAPNREPATSSD